MATVDRNEFLRGALAAGAASFASSVATNYTAHLEPSPALHELANVMRLLDAARDRLRGAPPDARGIDPALVAGPQTINEKTPEVRAAPVRVDPHSEHGVDRGERIRTRLLASARYSDDVGRVRRELHDDG